MKSVLSKDGLIQLWDSISTLFVRKETGKGLSSNDFTNEHKEQVDKLEITYVKQNDLDILKKYGIVMDGVTDDTDALQNYINDNIGGVLYFPKGTYRLAGYLTIPSDTTLIGYGAIIKFEAQIAMVNDADGETGGTDANENINVIGFTFIANTTDDCGSVGFGHSKNCKIVDCKFSGNAGWHMIEINSCDNVEINNCVFSDYGATNPTEMIQIDYAWGSQCWPWFGPYDKTPCTNIKIIGCSFYGDTTIEGSGIGNHADSIGSASADKIKNVHIENCYFKDLYSALKFVIASDITMDNCLAENVLGGFYGTSYVENVKIVNNVLRGRNDNSTSEFARGIYLKMTDYSVTASSLHTCIVDNNIIENFGNHGIAMSGYDHIISNNVIRGNSRYGIISGYDNRDCVYANNKIINNSKKAEGSYPDFKLSCYTSKDSVSGGLIIRDNTIGSLGMDNTNPTNKSYIINNIVDEYTNSYDLENVIIINNIVNGVLESQ